MKQCEGTPVEKKCNGKITGVPTAAFIQDCSSDLKELH
jgi:hypothetical protein